MILHELSHAFHDKYVVGGFGNAAWKAAYERAAMARLYDSVSVHGPQGAGGKKCQAYAINNEMEFFAELSVAFMAPEVTEGGGAGGGGAGEGGDGGAGVGAGGVEGTARGEYNKWFPYNRSQLKDHDPSSFAELRRLWRESTRALERKSPASSHRRTGRAVPPPCRHPIF